MLSRLKCNPSEGKDVNCPYQTQKKRLILQMPIVQVGLCNFGNGMIEIRQFILFSYSIYKKCQKLKIQTFIKICAFLGRRRK